MCGPGLAPEVAKARQSVLAQHLHHLVARRGAHLDQHADFFIEEGLECGLLAARLVGLYLFLSV